MFKRTYRKKYFKKRPKYTSLTNYRLKDASQHNVMKITHSFKASSGTTDGMGIIIFGPDGTYITNGTNN